ncbi:nucleotidyltransferase domain-containing protein [Solemya pervernicosa gill symbiont]|nr:nucleotidyltransferase family protein [Solemya pervernicosa gill symbiont]
MALSTLSVWPTPVQSLMLEASLNRDDAAISAWKSWYDIIDLDHLDHSSNRLIPLLYHRLENLGIADVDLGRMKGTFRRTWYHNQLIFARLATVLEALKQRNIPTLLLKGVPLTLLYYRDPGLRPMLDLDLMVPRKYTYEAIEVLTQLGWQAIDQRDAENSCLNHAVALRSQDGVEIDLHFSVVPECLSDRCNELFWQASQSVKHATFAAQTLDGAGHLVHTIVHGLRPNRDGSIRWIADAVLLMRSEKNIDWQRVVLIASRIRMGKILLAGLRYLIKHHEVVVPDNVIEQLSLQHISRLERFERCMRLDWPLLFPLAKFWGPYARLHEHRGAIALIVGFPRHLSGVLHANNPFDVLVKIGSRTFRYISRQLGH